jgi:hypothetical protein
VRIGVLGVHPLNEARSREARRVRFDSDHQGFD